MSMPTRFPLHLSLFRALHRLQFPPHGWPPLNEISDVRNTYAHPVAGTTPPEKLIAMYKTTFNPIDKAGKALDELARWFIANP